MIRQSDVQWWVLEAQKHPESAPSIIKELAARLIELDQENERLRDDLIRLRRGAIRKAGSAQVKALRRKVENLEYLLKSQSPTEPSLVFVSDRQGLVHLPLSMATKLAAAGSVAFSRQAVLQLCCMLYAHPHDELLALTNQARGFKLLIPDLTPWNQDQDWPGESRIELEPQERFVVATAVQEPPRFWTLVTRKGYVQRFVRVAFEREMSKGDPLLKDLFQHDEPVAIVNGDQPELLLVTRQGQAIRFPHRAIDVSGNVALELEHGDEVVGALSFRSDIQVLLFMADGQGVRRDLSNLAARSKPGGKGKRLVLARDVLSIYPYESQGQIWCLTYSAKMVQIPVAEVTAQSRLGKGTELFDLSHDPAISSAWVPQ